MAATINKINVGGVDKEIEDTVARNTSSAAVEDVDRLDAKVTGLDAKVDAIVAPTGEAPNPNEILDARHGANGVTYNTLGNAIRTQITNVVNSNFGPRVPTGNETKLADMLLNGVYYLEGNQVSNITDLPSGANSAQTSTLINYTNAYSNGGFVIQQFHQLNQKVWERLIVAENHNVYKNWYRIDIEDTYKSRALPNGTTRLSTIVQNGIYSITGSQMNIITDVPTEELGNAVHTLIVESGVYNGEYTFQTLIAVNRKAWSRTIVTATGEVYGDWERSDTVDTFQSRTIPEGITRLARVVKNGIYSIPGAQMANFTDVPDIELGSNVHTLIVESGAYNGEFTFQTLIAVNRRAWERTIITETGNTYGDWMEVMIPNGFDDVYCTRYADGTITSLAQYIKPGVYGLQRPYYSSLPDRPADSEDATSTLFVYPKTYAGSFVIQELKQLDGRVWERLVNADDLSVYTDWHRTDSWASDILCKKKLVTAGDSYTRAYFTGNQAQYDGKNFGYYIAQRNNMRFVNAGIDGSTMAVPSDGSTGRNPFSVDRYTSIPEDTDYLTLWFGINDAAHDTLGTIDDTENTTFYGAWNKVLRYYLEYRPFMKVLIIVTTGANENYRQAIRDVAKKWGYPYLDWVKDESIPAFFDRDGMCSEAISLRKNAYGYYGPVNGHPNPEWHMYESTIIEAKLRSI